MKKSVLFTFVVVMVVSLLSFSVFAMEDSSVTPQTMTFASEETGGMEASATITRVGVGTWPAPKTPDVQLIACDQFDEGAFYIYISNVDWNSTTEKYYVNSLDIKAVSEGYNVFAYEEQNWVEYGSMILYEDPTEILLVLNDPRCFALGEPEPAPVPEEPESLDYTAEVIICEGAECPVPEYEVTLEWLINEYCPFPEGVAFFEIIISPDEEPGDVCGVSLDLEVPCDVENLGLLYYVPGENGCEPTPCSWVPYEAEFVPGTSCEDPCRLTAVVLPEDLDKIFAVGPVPEEGPDFSDEGIIVVGEEPDQYMVGWTLNMEKCEESPDIAGSVTFEPVNPDPDYTGDDEAFFFSLDLVNPENICSLDLCLYGKGEDGVCSLEDEKSLFWFQEAISEWTELEVTYEVGTFVVGEETFCEMLCVHFPQGDVTPADLDDLMVVFGVDDGETDIFVEPVVPGPEEPGDDDTTEKSSGGGGCNVGTSVSAILIAIPLLMVLFRKR